MRRCSFRIHGHRQNCHYRSIARRANREGRRWRRRSGVSCYLFRRLPLGCASARRKVARLRHSRMAASSARREAISFTASFQSSIATTSALILPPDGCGNGCAEFGNEMRPSRMWFPLISTHRSLSCQRRSGDDFRASMVIASANFTQSRPFGNSAHVELYVSDEMKTLRDLAAGERVPMPGPEAPAASLAAALLAMARSSAPSKPVAPRCVSRTWSSSSAISVPTSSCDRCTFCTDAP